MKWRFNANYPQWIKRASGSLNGRMISVSMRRYVPNLISAALLVAAVLMYLHQEESSVVALSCANRRVCHIGKDFDFEMV